jgi:hypothetical protein
MERERDPYCCICVTCYKEYYLDSDEIHTDHDHYHLCWHCENKPFIIFRSSRVADLTVKELLERVRLHVYKGD